jgi:hypothetical protein
LFDIENILRFFNSKSNLISFKVLFAKDFLELILMNLAPEKSARLEVNDKGDLVLKYDVFQLHFA